MKNPINKIKNCKKLLNDNGCYGFDAFLVLLDMLYCKKRFHIGYGDYFFYDFKKFKNRYRKNFLLKYHQEKRYTLVNVDPNSRMRGKEMQYELFADMIRREWIVATPQNVAEIEEFIKKHKRVIFKPFHGTQGKGIFAVSLDDMQARKEEWLTAIARQEYICEEYVIQHKEMSRICESSVNTIRIITLCDGENVTICSAGLRTGSGKGVCDNMSIGGVGAAIDIETGVVFTSGVDFDKKRYHNHPVSGEQIIGFNIPHWNKVKQMVIDAAKRTSKTAIAGWDIAVMSDGPCLIEGNSRPAARLAQLAAGEPYGKEIIDFISSKEGKKRAKERKRIIKQIKKKKREAKKAIKN